MCTERILNHGLIEMGRKPGIWYGTYINHYFNSVVIKKRYKLLQTMVGMTDCKDNRLIKLFAIVHVDLKFVLIPLKNFARKKGLHKFPNRHYMNIIKNIAS